MISDLLDLPFRLGGTSYTIPAGMIENARFMAGRGRDMELVLFVSSNGTDNLPDRGVISGLRSAAEHHDLTYTVHLPVDLAPDMQPGGLLTGYNHQVIAETSVLGPYSYVVHLNGMSVCQPGVTVTERSRWYDKILHTLEAIGCMAGGVEKLAVENLESYPVEFLLPVFERIPVSACVDIGHLWLDENDPVPYLDLLKDRITVIHLHGVGLDDHTSLEHTSTEQLDVVVSWLLRAEYRNVVTLEVFNQYDFETSVNCVLKSTDRQFARMGER